MLKTIQAIALVGLIALTAGCGGGGGNSIATAQPQSLNALPLEMTGEWSIKNIGLPNDKLTVTPGGQVQISLPANNETVTIGRCSPDGSLDLNGAWTSLQKTYEINGSGSISSARSLWINASLRSDAKPLIENAQLNGDRETQRSYDTPPPVPNF